MEEQQKIWSKLYANTELAALRKSAENPEEFQRELKSIIDGYCRPGADVLEVGCATGVTSLILKDECAKTLLDTNPNAIALSKALFQSFGKEARFTVASLFHMPFPDRAFDLVFHAGVIEHFTETERVAALFECARVLENDGVMVVAFPNHFSLPYQVAYLTQKLLGRWCFPDEHSLYDLRHEITMANLVLERRFVVARKTAIGFLSFSRVLRSLFRIADHWMHFDGYLTVLIIRKKMVNRTGAS